MKILDLTVGSMTRTDHFDFELTMPSAWHQFTVIQSRTLFAIEILGIRWALYVTSNWGHSLLISRLAKSRAIHHVWCLILCGWAIWVAVSLVLHAWSMW